MRLTPGKCPDDNMTGCMLTSGVRVDHHGSSGLGDVLTDHILRHFCPNGRTDCLGRLLRHPLLHHGEFACVP